MRTIESSLMALLLFETLMHRITRHIVSELPMAGDVVADCLRLVARLYVAILIADAMMVSVLRRLTAEEWAAARPRRQARGGSRGGDLRLLALPQVSAWIPTSRPIRCRRPTPPGDAEDDVQGRRPRACAP